MISPARRCSAEARWRSSTIRSTRRAAPSSSRPSSNRQPDPDALLDPGHLSRSRSVAKPRTQDSRTQHCRTPAQIGRGGMSGRRHGAHRLVRTFHLGLLQPIDQKRFFMNSKAAYWTQGSGRSRRAKAFSWRAVGRASSAKVAVPCSGRATSLSVSVARWARRSGHVSAG